MCENISVDYAIMEKADEIFVLPASFGWSDLGTWGSLHENLPKDAHNNTQIGENIKLYETRNCVIHTTQEKRVVVQGLDGYIVAEKNNTLLICRLSEEQRIKEFSVGVNILSCIYFISAYMECMLSVICRSVWSFRPLPCRKADSSR